MVAITVILAAVIGAFVLNLGASQNSAPSASFGFNYETNSSVNATVVKHNGGDALDTDTIGITVGGTEIFSDSTIQTGADNGSSSAWTDPGTDVTAGDTLRVGVANNTGSGNFEEGADVTVTFSSPNSDETTILGESEVDY